MLSALAMSAGLPGVVKVGIITGVLVIGRVENGHLMAKCRT